MLRRRDNIQAEFESKTEALLAKHADREAVGLLSTVPILRVIHPLLFWKLSEIIFNKTEL